MVGKKPERNPMPEWAKEGLSPPGVEVQVYRRRQEDPGRWEYLGQVELENEVDLAYLEAAHAEELFNLLPFPETQDRWGGGDYQFRFFWRDEEGKREQKRSRNGSIWGRPLPRG